MPPELRAPFAAHTLLRIDGAAVLTADTDLPAWVCESLERAPWVVVRRALAGCEAVAGGKASSRGGLVPVGIRGDSRQQRFAAWVSEEATLEQVTPQLLASRRPWALAGCEATCARRAAVPALAALDAVEKIMRQHALAGYWGPGGSVGFELTSGRSTATQSSDLDIVVQLDHAIPPTDANSLLSSLTVVPVRTDVLLEMPHGAVALSEYARGESFVLRTSQGPRLVKDVADL
jgi:phosphoribosyl-dephospho-CoA transferase